MSVFLKTYLPKTLKIKESTCLLMLEILKT
jgi:hypothetical protein